MTYKQSPRYSGDSSGARFMLVKYPHLAERLKKEMVCGAQGNNSEANEKNRNFNGGIESFLEEE